jgi:hypothetical protein
MGWSVGRFFKPVAFGNRHEIQVAVLDVDVGDALVVDDWRGGSLRNDPEDRLQSRWGGQGGRARGEMGGKGREGEEKDWMGGKRKERNGWNGRKGAVLITSASSIMRCTNRSTHVLRGGVATRPCQKMHISPCPLRSDIDHASTEIANPPCFGQLETTSLNFSYSPFRDISEV